MHEAGDRAQGRRLPGTVAADERDDLALVDRDGHAAQRAHPAVEGVDPRELEERHQAPLPRYASMTR